MTELNLLHLIENLNNQSLSFEEHKTCLDEFLDYCSFVTNITADVTFDAFAQDTHLPSGMAINPQSAAMCVTDYHRTIGFIRAIHSAIEKLIGENHKKPIHILYAGCGPYATLFLGLIAKFQNFNIQFHLLDIHQSALDSSEILLKHFEIPKTQYKLICTDACRFEPAIEFDLIVSETMQKALEQEPQVQLTLHLHQFLTNSGIFIPESIDLQLALIHWKQELDISKANKAKNKKTNTIEFERINIGKAIHLSKQSCSDWINLKHEETKTPYIDFGIFETPEFDQTKQFDLSILTHIHLFNDHYLNEYDSDLTLPTKQVDVSPAKANTNYHLKYELGSYPRFELTPLKSNKALT